MTADTVLIVTASYDEAPELVIEALARRGTPTYRLNTDEFPSTAMISFSPSEGIVFASEAGQLEGSAVKSVWYRRHVAPILPSGLSSGIRDFCERETQAFLDGVLACLPTHRWMSPPQALRCAERKPFQLAVATQLGFFVPATLIANDPVAVRGFSKSRELIAKAVSSGYIAHPNGNRAIFTSIVGREDVVHLDELALAPVTFQQFVEKSCDIRVTVVDGLVFAAEILSQEDSSSRVDWRATDDPDLRHGVHELPQAIARQCKELVQSLGLRFGAIDLALLQDGTYAFFEINPNGEWLWIEDRLGFPISESIAHWLDCETK